MSAQAVEAPVVTTAAQAVSLPASVWRDALAAVLLSVSKDGMLPVLTTVKVEAEIGVTLTSTDRFRLTRVTAPVKPDARPSERFTVLLPSDLVKRMHALVKHAKYPAESEPWTLTLDGESVTFAGWSDTVSGRAFDGDFPWVDSIVESAGTSTVSKGTDRLTVGYDPRYLADLCKMPRQGGTKSHPTPVKLSIGDPGKPALAEWSIGEVEYLHILMPVRLAS